MAPRCTNGPSGPSDAPAPTCVERTRRADGVEDSATLSDAADALK